MLHKQLKLNAVNLLFADDKVIIAKSEECLHTSPHKLAAIAADYNLTISVDKMKVMAIMGRHLCMIRMKK
jgi:hypothetical protein